MVYLKPKKWVLIVDDDQDFCETVSDALTDMEFKCITSGKLQEARTKFKNQKFDLILLDMHLGTENGEELIETLKEEKSNFNHTTPIIVISGFLDPDLISRIGKKVNGILVKPFNLGTFREKVEAVIKSPQTTLR